VDHWARINEARRKQREANEAEEFDWEDDKLRYNALRRRFPDLIRADKEVPERLARYKIGDAKVDAIRDVGKRFRERSIQLDKERFALNSQIYSLTDEENMIADEEFKYRRKNKPIPPEITRRMDDVGRRRAAAVAARAQVINEQDRIEGDKIRAAHAFLRTNDPASFYADPADDALKRARDLDPPSGDNVNRINEALMWLKANVARGDESTIEIKIGQKAGQRAYHAGDGSHIAIDTNEDPATIIHEYGHAIESDFKTGDRDMGDRARSFLKYRVGDEQPVSLRDVFHAGYDQWEMGRKDKFDEAWGPGSSAYYVGKVYNGLRPPTEIISMSIEKLYRDPVGFVEKDPEFAKWIMGIMDGSLR
jgi:hypothetical protein